MKYGELTVDEIRRAADQDSILIVPTGCTEQQSRHLPVDFDTWFAEEVCSAASVLASEQFGIHSLVLPALPFAPTPEHRGFGTGFIDLPQELHEKILEAVLQSLTDQNFRRFVLWRGCGRHDFDALMETFLERAPADIKVFIPAMPFQRVWESLGDPEVPGGHADAFTTSIALHLRPDAVRRDRIRKPNFTIPNWDDPALDLTEHTDTGSIGDPTSASAELGERLWAAVVEEAASMIRDFDQSTGVPSDEDERSP